MRSQAELKLTDQALGTMFAPTHPLALWQGLLTPSPHEMQAT